MTEFIVHRIERLPREAPNRLARHTRLSCSVCYRDGNSATTRCLAQLVYLELPADSSDDLMIKVCARFSNGCRFSWTSTDVGSARARWILLPSSAFNTQELA